MDYREKYEQSLEKARELLSCCIDDRDRRTKIYRVEDIESIFPDLQESENEKIRKGIIGLVKQSSEILNKQNQKDMLAWLEKQGEQESIDYNEELKKCRENPLYFIDKYVKFEERKPAWSKEDERMRKEIINFLRLPHSQFVGKRAHEKWITWLEKQKNYIKLPNSAYTSNKDVNEFADKYSHIVWEKLMNNFKKIENYSIGCNDVSDIVLNAIINTYIWLEGQGEKKRIFNADDWYVSEVDGKIHNAKFIENQGENNPTDETEPKFKPGDWIIFNGLTLHIDEVVNGYPYGYYRTTSRGDGIHNSYDWNIDNAARLWTIQDAKEGDVLANKHNILILKELDYDWSCNGTPNAVKAYCGIKPNGNFEIGKDNWCFCGTLYIHPATKEQRDTLFAKMADAGYKWNSEKKELRKVEQKPADKPKFKVGDWFVNNNRKDVFLIKSINTNGYCTLEDIKGNIISPCLPPCESDSHIWTIEDAKDGDVLTNSKIIVIFKQIVEPKYKQHIEAYIGLDLGCDIQVTSEFWSLGIDKAMPATKEQCDLLFSKMKEAGYEWDSEKKELKRIEPKKVNADKVIEWLKNTIREKAENYGVYKETRLVLPYNSIEDLIKDFKEDFGL